MRESQQRWQRSRGSILQLCLIQAEHEATGITLLARACQNAGITLPLRLTRITRKSVRHLRFCGPFGGRRRAGNCRHRDRWRAGNGCKCAGRGFGCGSGHAIGGRHCADPYPHVVFCCVANSKSLSISGLQLPEALIVPDSNRGHHINRQVYCLLGGYVDREGHGGGTAHLISANKDELVSSGPDASAGVPNPPRLYEWLGEMELRMVRDGYIADECGAVAASVNGGSRAGSPCRRDGRSGCRRRGWSGGRGIGWPRCR
jgi:hypothetical protein